jgi:hypothetical protein
VEKLLIILIVFVSILANTDECDSIRIDSLLNIPVNRIVCKKFIPFYKDIAEYFKSFKHPNEAENGFSSDSLLILYTVKSPFGGIIVYVALEDNFQQVFRLWVYEIDNDIYQIREEKTMNVDNSECLKNVFRKSTPCVNMYSDTCKFQQQDIKQQRQP